MKTLVNLFDSGVGFLLLAFALMPVFCLVIGIIFIRKQDKATRVVGICLLGMAGLLLLSYLTLLAGCHQLL